MIRCPRPRQRVVVTQPRQPLADADMPSPMCLPAGGTRGGCDVQNAGVHILLLERPPHHCFPVADGGCSTTSDIRRQDPPPKMSNSTTLGARQDKRRQDKTRQDKTREGNTRDETRQDKQMLANEEVGLSRQLRKRQSQLEAHVGLSTGRLGLDVGQRRGRLDSGTA